MVQETNLLKRLSGTVNFKRIKKNLDNTISNEGT